MRTLNPFSAIVLGITALLAAVPAKAISVSQIFSPPPLAPLTMTVVSGRNLFETPHAGVFGGHRVAYIASVEEAVIEDGGGVPAADMYDINYVAKDTAEAASRPVMFIFNGGPGASSAFLQFCSLGPKILRDCSPAGLADSRTSLVENDSSPLDAADLVFVDPTDTGWSHTLPGVSADQFHSVDGDSDEVAALIVWWLKTHHRLASPVYVYGESYGTMRAVAVVRDLARSTPKVAAAGLILGGFCITFGPGSGTTDPAWEAMRLPTAASMAWYYGKIDNKQQSWSQAVNKAMVFARTEYVGALVQGFALSPTESAKVINGISALSGIPQSYFKSHHTISLGDYGSALLSDRGLVLDGENGMWTHPAGKKPSREPSKLFATTMRRYAQGDLQVHGIGEYEVVTPNILPIALRWNYKTSGAPSLEVTLAGEMKANSRLRLLVMQGRYDTTTEVADTLYVLDQTYLPRSRVKIAYYNGGHMLAPTAGAMRAIRGFLTQ